MSTCGTKRTFYVCRRMSVLGGKAVMQRTSLQRPILTPMVLGSIHRTCLSALSRSHLVVDVLVAHERPQQFRGLQGALGVGGDVVGVFVEVGVDQVDRLVLGIVIRLALLRRQIGRASCRERV